jgi:hypothetical protein
MVIRDDERLNFCTSEFHERLVVSVWVEPHGDTLALVFTDEIYASKQDPIAIECWTDIFYEEVARVKCWGIFPAPSLLPRKTSSI